VDANGYQMMTQPVKIGEKDGCSLYGNGIAIVAKDRIPLWIPVTVREFDEALLRNLEKLGRENPGDRWAHEMMAGKVKEGMAALSPEELGKPAYQGGLGASPTPYEENAPPLVKLNPNYFDKSKPRTAIQLIIVESSNISLTADGSPFYVDENSDYSNHLHADIMKGIKFKELKSFLE
jgi:hypothetical protein